MIRRAFAIAAAATIALAASGVGHSLTVDGVVYEPTKVSGAAVHYEAPVGTVVFSERHVWEGHGSEHLPCEVGHWIDNENVLTLSHCLDVPVTTTVPETTTTTEATTTTTEATTTTSSVPEDTTTTSTPEDTTTTSSVPETTTSSTPEQTTTTTLPELPKTGGAEWLALGIAGFGLIGLGAALLRRFRVDTTG